MSKKFVPRIYVKEHLCGQKSIAVDAQVAHYLRVVMRLGVGESIFVFNAQDGEFEAKITSLSKSGAQVYTIQKIRYPETLHPVRLLCALIAKDRFRLVIEKGTELGVTRFSPVLTQHTNTSHVQISKVQEHALAAVRQCGRLDMPTIDPPKSLPSILKNWQQDLPLVYCTEREEGKNIGTISAKIKGRPLAILVGPEGGFSEEEHTYILGKLCAIPVKLGNRLIRSETASVAALSILQAMVGDWST